MYFKILNKQENHNGFQYQTGINTDTIEFNHQSCSAGGLYYSNEQHICAFLDYGCWIREIRIRKGTEIFKERNKCKSPEIRLMKRRDLSKISTWKWMNKNNVDITASDNLAVQFASHNGHLEVVKYLESL